MAQPLGVITLSIAVTFILSFTRRMQLMRAILSGALILLFISSFTSLGQVMLSPLENRFVRPTPEPETITGVIVLGGGMNGHVTLARGGYELAESGDRFVEAARLALRYPHAAIVLSGGDASLVGVTEGDALVAPRLLSGLGVDPDRILVEGRSRNTSENAQFTAQIPAVRAGGRWLLVTSAFHMPRAVGAFRKAGLSVEPWPVDYRTQGVERFSIGRDDPLRAFGEFNLALREWIGLAAYRLTGRIDALLPGARSGD